MEFTVLENRIEAVVDGKVLAEIDFPACEGGVDICHTFVDDSLRGPVSYTHLTLPTNSLV